MSDSTRKHFGADGLTAALAECQGRSRSLLVELPVKDFLGLVPASTDPDKLASLGQLVARGVPLRTVPQLLIEFAGDEARVRGHEGRHRALALLERDVTVVPVILRAVGVRWSLLDDEGAIVREVPHWRRWPRDLVSQDGRMRMPFPFSQAEAHARAMALQEVQPNHVRRADLRPR